MQSLKISSYTLTTALGAGVSSNWLALKNGASGLKPCSEIDINDLTTWVGEVSGLDAAKLDENLNEFECRNNRLAALALEQDNFSDRVRDAINRYGKHRVAIYIGTSTSGIQHTELAYAERQAQLPDNTSLPEWYSYANTHNIYSPAEFVRQYFELDGLCMSVSTACSSSAKVFASAQRALEADLCDAVIVGGVDTLCYTTLYGFNSLQVIAQDICRPSDTDRDGISIGEAAGFALIEKQKPSIGDIAFLGYGESADAYHMSTPHPEGKGAELAMRAALDVAELEPQDVDYINLHGTGTKANDLSESISVSHLFGTETPCSSTKGWTGHTLGAAGIVEAIYSMLCIKNNWLPQSLNTNQIDPKITSHILEDALSIPVKTVLSNSFGFGGSNCSLIFGEVK
ncbi:MAG: beta-ketoacyl-[acyl-carrier-protein] synthase family protein [Agarilytica sp.]